LKPELFSFFVKFTSNSIALPRPFVSGQIDILQVRMGKIYILDFKLEASKENENKVSSQLYWYALCLSFRTSIPLTNFVCACFDEKIYYEFRPI
jgi:ATP-dependent exoDNAse (exonuclease V) beta subunit